MNTPMRRPLSLRRVTESLLWFALGVGALAGLFVLDRRFGDFGGNVFLFALLVLAPGAALGAAVGALIGRRDLCAALGLVLWIAGLLAFGLMLRLFSSA